MIDKKKALALSVIIPLAILIFPSAFAEPTKHKNYDIKVIGTDQDGNQIIQWTSQPERIVSDYVNGKPVYSDYRLVNLPNEVRVETQNSGSIIFDKTACNYDIYENGIITNNPAKINNISWTVKGKLSSASTWSNVNSINNAACNVTIQEDGTKVRLIGEKTNTVGIFQIVLDYRPGLGFKETMRAYNNNPTWTNHNVGFTETFEVPRIIKFGKQTYDLANYNGTVLGRNWIENNEAKILNLFDNYYYDFGIGFDNLNDVKITYQNGIAKLSLNYLYPSGIVPYQQWVEVDPTFGPSTATNYQVQTPFAALTTCPTSGSYTKTATNPLVGVGQSNDAGNGCYRGFFLFDVTAISDNIGSISTMNFTTTTSAPISMGGKSCDLHRVMLDPSTAGAQALWFDLESHTEYVSASTNCQTANTYTLQLPSSAKSELISSVRAGNNTFSMGMKLADETRDTGSGHAITFGTTTLKVVYTLGQTPYAVRDLTATGLASNAVALSWTAPNANGTTLQSYQINYTTPWGNPQTILINTASLSTTSYTVGDLAERTPYSFRIGVRADLGNNMSGNIANATSGVRTGNFTIGYFNLNATNPLFEGIQFERTDTNNTHTNVRVIFDEDYTLRCTVASTFAQTSNTYNITGTPYDTDRESSVFTFINHENDVINIDCWDTGTNDTGNYYLNQESGWVLLNMIQNFRNGTYGTEGRFGAFDFVTFIVLILGMIGLNRVNEALGGIFMVVSIGALAALGIITWEAGIIFGTIAFVVMLAIVTTRKD